MLTSVLFLFFLSFSLFIVVFLFLVVVFFNSGSRIGLDKSVGVLGRRKGGILLWEQMGREEKKREKERKEKKKTWDFLIVFVITLLNRECLLRFKLGVLFPC